MNLHQNWMLYVMRHSAPWRKPIAPRRPGKREVVTWLPASQKPDSDQTVHINAPGLDDPIWLGYWNAAENQWYTVEGLPIGDAVVEYAHMLKGRL